MNKTEMLTWADRVEEGDFSRRIEQKLVSLLPYGDEEWFVTSAIRDDSLDAALRLLEEVLPGDEEGKCIDFIRRTLHRHPAMFDRELPKFIVADLLRSKAEEIK